MTKYRRDLPNKLPVVDTPQMRAAMNLVAAVDGGKIPDRVSLKTLRDAFVEMTNEMSRGRDGARVFGRAQGRPGGSGFTSDDIVSAYIELRRRALATHNPRNALSLAQREVPGTFVDVSGEDVMRAVKRHWSKGRKTVENLSDAELLEILKPHEIVE